MWQKLEVEEMPRAEDSVLLVALSTMAPQYAPLYSHGRELAKFLLEKVQFKRFATFYSSALPPAVAIDEDGVLRLHSNRFYSHAAKRRVLLLAGDGSPMDDQQEYAHVVLSFARELGAKEVVSVGARWAESPTALGAPLKPVGFASDEKGAEELERLGVKVTKGEPGPFFPNLIVGMAEDYGMRGFKVGVDHGEPVPHPRSVIQIMGVLSRMLGISVETKSLLSRAKEMEREGTGEALPEVRRERGGIYG